MVVALSSASWGAVYGARVRWQPSGETVSGYRVWVRPANGTYGTSRDAGMPTMAGDGSYSFLVAGLDPRTDYAVSVSAYVNGSDSGRSNEMQIGYAQVAPIIDSDGDGLKDATEDANLNRTVDSGETDPTRADTDGDGVGDAADRCGGTTAGAAVNAQGCACAQITCDDGNACNGVETCQAGVCHPGTSPSCDDGNPCTTDGCRAATGCTHVAVPSCSSCTSNAQCNDGNPCTTDTCNAGTCRSTPAADGTACGDGNACNGNETCQAGACRAGSAPSCDDGNACTTDSCDAATGCTHATMPSCRACTSGAQCNDNNPCTTDSCNAGTCRNAPAADGTACGDGNACNGNETCQAGACRAGSAPSCDDGNACTTDSCDTASGCTHTAKPSCRACTSDAQCSDGNACNGTETCRAGACAAGTAPSCDDGDACTADACSPSTGCTHTSNGSCGACPHAIAFAPQGGTVTGQTQGTTSRFTGACEVTSSKSPDNVYAWTPTVSGTATISTCGAATKFDTVLSLRRGTCDGGEEIGCNDDTEGCAVASPESLAHRQGSKITTQVTAGETYYIIVDGYDARSGVYSLTVTAPTPCTVASCDDGNACTTDACGDAGCTHTPVAGCASCSRDADCADDNACTTDVCAAGRCEHRTAADGTSCADGDACDGAEVCRAGRCTAGTPLVCDDGNACTTDSCNPSAGCVHASVAGCTGCTRDAQCADNDPCTADVCTAGRCQHPAAADGTSCGDGNLCNGNETCRAGRCGSGPRLSCDDGDACTNDSCNPTSGCTHSAVTGCSACTTAADCDDHEACTADACVEGRCSNTTLADGSSCTDGNFCNGTEQCRAGHCAAGTAPDCNDDNSCTTDSCDPGANQCTHTSTTGCCTSDADCGDTDACTTHERCEAGVCVSDPVQCAEPGSCQQGMCDPAKGCTTVALPDGTACEDGDPCTKQDECHAGTCGVPTKDEAVTGITGAAGIELDASDFVLRRISKRTWRLSASGSFAVSAEFDPVNSGLSFGILDDVGSPLYQADVPAGGFVWRNGRYSYRPDDSRPEDGLKKIDLQPSAEGVTVSVTARVPATVAVTPGMVELRRHVAASVTGRKLTWTLSMGSRCVRDKTLVCPTGRSTSKRCR